MHYQKRSITLAATGIVAIALTACGVSRSDTPASASTRVVTDTVTVRPTAASSGSSYAPTPSAAPTSNSVSHQSSLPDFTVAFGEPTGVRERGGSLVDRKHGYLSDKPAYVIGIVGPGRLEAGNIVVPIYVQNMSTDAESADLQYLYLDLWYGGEQVTHNSEQDNDLPRLRVGESAVIDYTFTLRNPPETLHSGYYIKTDVNGGWNPSVNAVLPVVKGDAPVEGKLTSSSSFDWNWNRNTPE